MSENVKITRRCLVRILSYTAAALAVLAAFAIKNAANAKKYNTAAVYMSRQNAAELTGYLSNIDISLKKGMYTGTPEGFEKLAVSLWRDASCAKQALEGLPVSYSRTSSLNRFLSQVGDYSMYLSECINNGKIPEDMEKSLTALSEYSTKLNSSINKVSLDVQHGLDFSAVDKKGGQTSPFASDGFYDIEDELTSYPTLIYDGPFSDQALEKKPEMLEKLNETDKNTALNSAKKMCKNAQNLKYLYDEKGTVKCYVFSGSNYTAGVSIQGGLPVYMNYNHKVGKAKLDVSQAEKNAEEYMKSLGFEGFKMTGYEIYGDICTTNWAYTFDGVICYPDLIKTDVALDDGTIVGFDAAGYFMNHKERTVPKALKPVSEARDKVGRSLEVTETGLVFIPVGTREKLCYEFKCSGKNGDTVLVYINALTLSEEDLLIVLESEYAKLTI